MLCTGSLVSSYLYKANGTPYEYVKSGARRHSRAEIALMKQEDLTHARRLREKWRAWAEMHQNLLRRMYRRKGDAATLQAFVDAVPGMVIHDPARNPSPEGMQVTAEDLGSAVTGAHVFGPEESETRRNRLFTWLPFSVKGYQQTKWTTRTGEATSPPPHSDEGRAFNLERWRKTFSETGEVALSSAGSPETPCVILWASGRITTMVNDSGDRNGHLDTAENNPQVEPPYEFLR